MEPKDGAALARRTVVAPSLSTSEAAGPSSRVAGGGRGWQILRRHWREFLRARPGIGERVRGDMCELAQAPSSSQRGLLPREAADRAFDRILARMGDETPRGAKRLKTWQRAKLVHSEARAVLDQARSMGGGGSPAAGSGGGAGSGSPTAAEGGYYGGMDHRAEALFPAQWSEILTPDLLAELVVDAFLGSFCDELVDAALGSLERFGKSGAVLQNSHSAPSLQGNTATSLSRPRALQPLATMGSSATVPRSLLDGAEPGLPEGFDGPPTGFTTAGLARDGREAWATQRFHVSRRLDPLAVRIHEKTEAQRPCRRLVRQPDANPLGPKYSWPMAATNFPGNWDQATQRRDPRDRAGASAAPTSMSGERSGRREPLPPQPFKKDENWLLGKDRLGRTTFPYSLALHRAFLEAQPDPVLKEKARKVAPLRLTTGM